MITHQPGRDAAPLSAADLTGPVRLLAGPGTGKTHALVSLYAELVESGRARRSDILVLTFSNSAAEEIGRRLDERLLDSYDRAWISTFHSFCARLLREHSGGESLQLNGFQEFLVMRRVLRRLEGGALGPLEPLRASDVFAQDALAFVSLLKQNLVQPAPFSLQAGGSGSPRLRGLAAVFSAYQAQLERAGMLDFRDLISGAIELLQRDPPLLERVRGQFQYVLVDEFQDLDPAQFELLKLIAPPSLRPRLAVAGDPDQAIYGFRGTVPTLLVEDFPAVYSCTTAVLDASRRCPPEVLNAAELVLAQTQPLLLRVHSGSPGSGGEVKVAEEVNSVEEGFFVAREIKRLMLEEGRRPGSFAILLRSALTLSGPFEEALRALQVPYEVRGLASLPRNEVVRFLLAYLRSLGEHADEDALARLLSSSLSGVGPATVGRLRARAGEEGRSITKVLRQLMYQLAEFDPAEFPLPWEAAPTAAPELFPEPRSWDVEYLALEDARAVHAGMHSWYHLRHRARRVPLATLAYEVLIDGGVMERLLGGAGPAGAQSDFLADLRSTLAGFSDLDEVLARLDGASPILADLGGQLDHLVLRAVDEAQATAATRDAVQILTVHQAKGLEFDVVFVSGFAAGIFPTRMRPNPLLSEADQGWLVANLDGFRPSWPVDQAGHLAEEGRLAYVAFTRARRHLYLTYAREYEQVAGASAFLEALRDSVEVRPPAAPRLPEPEDVLSRRDAETLLAGLREAFGPETETELAGAGLDVGFITDPESGRQFQPYERRPQLVDPHHFSATDLTAYVKCPRLYWYTHHPGLAAPPRSAEMERGGFIHQVLEDFHRREPEWRHLPSDAARQWLEAAIDEHLEPYLARIERVLDRQREEQEVRRILRNYAEFATSFQKVRRLGTISTEKRFLLHLELPEEFRRQDPKMRQRAEIHGKIDRINDTGGGTCEVVDYKTGNGHSAGRDYASYFGEDMYDVQLAIYYLACLEGTDEAGRPLNLVPRFLSLWYPKDRRFDAAVRQVLFSVGQPAGLSKWWEKTLSDEDLRRAQSVVLEAIRGILTGDFSPRPREGVVGTCQSFSGCAHEAICPFARAGIE